MGDKVRMDSKNIGRVVVRKRRIRTIFLSLIVFVFFLGFFAGWFFADDGYTEADLRMKRIELDLISFSQRMKFERVFGEGVCDKDFLDGLSSERLRLRDELVLLESEGKIDSEYYDFLKKEYNVNQVLYYSLLKEFLDKCGGNFSVILFFFDESEDSLIQGEELDKLVAKGGVEVIAMHYNYTPSLSYFYDFYDVSKLPFLVIDYNRSIEGFVSFSDGLMFED